MKKPPTFQDLLLQSLLLPARVLLAILALILAGAALTPPALRLHRACCVDASVADAARRSEALRGLPPSTLIRPVGARFTLADGVGAEELAFFRYHGFLVFAGALDAAEAAELRAERRRLESDLVGRGVKSVRGVPLFFGACADGKPCACVARIPFANTMSPAVARAVADSRFEPVKQIVADAFGEANASAVRLGAQEKDGVVMNNYVSPPLGANNGDSFFWRRPWSRHRLGWHTDALRDIAYFTLPGPMLNVGLHLDDVDPDRGDAALCLLPGTHRQSMLGFAFRKVYFLSHDDDPEEVCVATAAGDLTVHDGRLWHRVRAGEPREGSARVRRSMYLPYLPPGHPYEPKGEGHSTTPFYHYLGMAMRRLQGGA